MAQTTITTAHGTFTGKTVETIVRRVYGRDAFVRPKESIGGQAQFYILRSVYCALGETKHKILAVITSWDGVYANERGRDWEIDYSDYEK